MTFLSQRLYNFLEWTQFYRDLQDYGNSLIQMSVVDSIYRQTQDAHVIQTRLFEPEIPEWVKKAVPLRLDILMMFGTLPNSLGKYHKDGFTRKAALNVPLNGGDKGCIEWSAEDIEELKIYGPRKEVRISKKEQTNLGFRFDLPIRDRMTLSQPVLLDTNEWHRVNNLENNEYRFVLSLRFFGNPDLNTLIKLFDTKKTP